MWCLAVCVLLLGAVGAEVVTFANCPLSDDEPARTSNCTIDEVRISPCAEASQGKPCVIKRGRSASIEFDFTSSVNVDSVTGKVYWVSQAGDFPFVGMNTDGCSFTTCPIVAGNRQSYVYQLNISKKFPVRSYDIKWRVWNEQADILECCFLTKIKLVK